MGFLLNTESERYLLTLTEERIEQMKRKMEVAALAVAVGTDARCAVLPRYGSLHYDAVDVVQCNHVAGSDTWEYQVESDWAWLRDGQISSQSHRSAAV